MGVNSADSASSTLQSVLARSGLERSSLFQFCISAQPSLNVAFKVPN